MFVWGLVLTSMVACRDDNVGAKDNTSRWSNLQPVPVYSFTPSQPVRKHPYAVAMTPDGNRAVVTLRGSEAEPAEEVVIINVPGKRIESRVTVGKRPVAVGIHPDGDLAVVLSHLSPYAAVIDIARATVTTLIEVGYYAEDLVFTPDGRRMLIASRMNDQIAAYAITRSGNLLEATAEGVVNAGTNPSAITLSADASLVYTADAVDLGIRVFEVATLTQTDFIPINAPVLDIQVMGNYLLVATLNDTSGLPCEDDSDYPGEQGDGVFETITDRTCSRGFADVQNELAFIDLTDNSTAIRYTSDSAQVSEADREGDHEVELMKVQGSLPNAVAVVSPTRAFVTMGASFNLVELSVEQIAGSPPRLDTANIWPTGLAPRGIAVNADGSSAVVANMLGETVSVFDTATGERADIVVGNAQPPFPATSEEIGELLFFTSRYSSDGDISCAHCHIDGEADGKGWGVAVVRAFGRRATMSTRNLGETQPLLIEGVFGPADFSLELEGLAFRPDFHDSSFTLQVSRRDQHFRDVSEALMGQDISYETMVTHLGNFLVAEPRLLPSPFPKDTPQVESGRDLYFQFEVACMLCHPSPTFASPENFEGIVTMGRFDRPSRSLDPDTSIKFLEEAQDGFFNANTLRGAWDRRGGFFHDGRARTLRETLLTPNHPCLQLGEQGFNQFNGEGDSHGGISHLSCEQIDNLVAFMLTLD